MRNSNVRPLAVVLSLAMFAGRAHGAPACGPVVPALCRVPARLRIVGETDNGGGAWLADPAGKFKVELRDATGAPVSNCEVTLDFSACPDFELLVRQPDPAVQVKCKQVTKAVDATGVATFDVVGRRKPTLPCASGAVGPSVRVVTGAGALIRTVPVQILDLDGGGLSGSDAAAWVCIFGSGVPLACADYDGDGLVTIADLALLNAAIGTGASLKPGDTSAGYCP